MINFCDPIISAHAQIAGLWCLLGLKMKPTSVQKWCPKGLASAFHAGHQAFKGRQRSALGKSKCAISEPVQLSNQCSCQGCTFMHHRSPTFPCSERHHEKTNIFLKRSPKWLPYYKIWFPIRKIKQHQLNKPKDQTRRVASDTSAINTN